MATRKSISQFEPFLVVNEVYFLCNQWSRRHLKSTYWRTHNGIACIRQTFTSTFFPFTTFFTFLKYTIKSLAFPHSLYNILPLQETRHLPSLQNGRISPDSSADIVLHKRSTRLPFPSSHPSIQATRTRWCFGIKRRIPHQLRYPVPHTLRGIIWWSWWPCNKSLHRHVEEHTGCPRFECLSWFQKCPELLQETFRAG